MDHGARCALPLRRHPKLHFYAQVYAPFACLLLYASVTSYTGRRSGGSCSACTVSFYPLSTRASPHLLEVEQFFAAMLACPYVLENLDPIHHYGIIAIFTNWLWHRRTVTEHGRKQGCTAVYKH